MYINQNNSFDSADDKLIARFTSYMVKVVKSAKVDYIRRQSRWSLETPMDNPPESYVNSQDMERWQSGVPDNEFYFTDDSISDALSDLPHIRRRILELSFIERMPAIEIAELLDCTVTFVYDQKHTALKKLRDMLLKGGGQGE